MVYFGQRLDGHTLTRYVRLYDLGVMTEDYLYL